MGRSRTHAGRALTEKQDRFVRLIAKGVSNRTACRIVEINRRTGTRWLLGRTIRNTAGEAALSARAHPGFGATSTTTAAICPAVRTGPQPNAACGRVPGG
jgi:molybdate-binding protein